MNTPVPHLLGLPLEQANAQISAVGLTPDPDPLVSSWITYADLIAHVKRMRGKTLYLHAGQVGRIDTGDKGGPYPYEASAHVVVSKPALLTYLAGAYLLGCRDQVQIRVAESNHCFFVGSSSHTW